MTQKKIHTEEERFNTKKNAKKYIEEILMSEFEYFNIFGYELHKQGKKWIVTYKFQILD